MILNDTVSSSSTRVILFVIFGFSEKKMLNSFPECFIVTYFWRIKRSFLYKLLQ